MNVTLHTISQHRSIRAYTDQHIPDTQLNALIEAVQHAPNSINGQQISLIVTRDAGSRKKISEICGGQPWIAQAPVFITIVMDFHKTDLALKKRGKKQVIQESVESIVVGSVDAGIILGNLMTAAESLGLGIVPIGAIRRDPQAMIDLLNLPPLTYPVAGMCLGHTAGEHHKKPRLPMETFRHDETYNKDVLANAIDRYDRQLTEHWSKIGRNDGESWTQSISGFYDKVYFPQVYPTLKKQGFINDK